MYYVYHIMEKVYCGRYGIDEWFLNEQDNLSAAKSYARNASKALMKKYNSIESKVHNMAFQRAQINNEDFNNALEKTYNENIYYELYEVDNKSFANETVMYHEFINQRNNFLIKFCKQII